MAVRRGYRSVERVAPGVQFVDMLPAGRSATAPEIEWELVARQLDTRPGKWARITMAEKVWAGPGLTVCNYAAFRPRGAYEAAVRNGELYMRKVAR